MQEEFRPALKEVLLAYGAVSALIWILISGFALFLPPPSVLIPPVVEAAAALVAAFFAYKCAWALWLNATERYYIDDGLVSIRRGWTSKRSTTITREKISEAGVDSPILLKAFGVGHMWIYTSDCRAYPLYNLKDPISLALRTRLTPKWDPVFRPSVG